MTNPNESLPCYFADLTRYAVGALNCTLKTIKSTVSDKDYCLIICYDDTEEIVDRIFEIRMGNTTLSCFLDEDNKCAYSYLFMDSADNIEQYIRDCNANYKYNYIDQKWSLPNCYMSIVTLDEDIVFAFEPADV